MKTIFKGLARMIVLALMLLTAAEAEAMTFKGIVVFSGSVSDSGNFFALTGIRTSRPTISWTRF